MKRHALLPALAIVSAAFCGCVTRSPILMYRDGTEENPRKVPLKVGLDKITFQFDKEDITKIKTTDVTGFPFVVFFSGTFPRTDEKEFVQDCIVQYIQDVNLFDFIYSSPYDPKDIDVVVKVHVKEFEVANSGYGTTLNEFKFCLQWLFPMLMMNINNASTTYPPPIPMEAFYACYLINLMIMIGQLSTLIPQEFFFTTQAFQVDICLPNGDRILSYESRVEDSDYVHMWQQPFATYLWYKSVFKKVFLKVWDDIRAKIEADGAQIVAAVERSKRGE